MKRGADEGDGAASNGQPKKQRFHFFSSRTFVAPISTPFTPDDEVDYDAVPRVARQMRQNGFNAVFIAGTNGESYALAYEERRKLLERWMETDEVKTKKLQVIAHISSQSLKESKMLAIHAAGLGVECVSYMSSCVGFWTAKTEDDSADLLVELAKAVPNTKVIFYHFPGLTGLHQKVAPILARAGKAASNVIGCKFTHDDLDDFRECVSLGFDMIIGNGDSFLLETLGMGGAGCFSVSTMAGCNFLPALWESCEKGEAERARKLQAMQSRAWNVLVDHPNGFMSAGKYLIGESMGMSLGKLRAPVPATENDPELVRSFKEVVSATVE